MTLDHALSDTSDIREIIDLLAMERHPRAGWFAPHYSDSETKGRPKFSSIYYLLAGDEPVSFHKGDAIEVWHHYMGAAAQFVVTNRSRLHMTSIVGRDLAAGQRPQLLVPAYLWQSYRSLGAWTLLGCTASPGFWPQATFVMDAEA